MPRHFFVAGHPRAQLMIFGSFFATLCNASTNSLCYGGIFQVSLERGDLCTQQIKLYLYVTEHTYVCEMIRLYVYSMKLNLFSNII